MGQTIGACAFWMAVVLAVATECLAADEWAIRPGQETLLTEMLGKDRVVAGDCRFTGGGVRYATIEATYACSEGEVDVELTHPSAPGAPAVHTDKFALRIKSGPEKSGLLDELAALIRPREAAFEWELLQTGTGGAAASSWPRGLIALLGVVAIASVLWRYRTNEGFARRFRSAARLSSGGIRFAFRQLAERLLLVLVAVVIGWAISEFVVRRTGADERVMNNALLFQQTNPEVHRVADDWFLHYDLRPGAHLDNVGYWNNRYHANIDEFGARAPAHQGKKEPGVFRIMCFGGSTMYGADVSDEETIPAALERRLNEQEPQAGGGTVRRFEAWNFGTHAYVLSQAAHRARTELVARDPDLILVQLHNIGPRGFFLEPGGDQWTTLRRYAMDPHLLEENFPPVLLPAMLHPIALRHSAAYRFLVAFLRRRYQLATPYAEELSRDEARALTREAAARHVPVVFFSIPSDGSGPIANTVYPELPPEQFINFHEPGHEPDYYMMHPPARFLDEYAGQLIVILRQRGYLPR